MKPWAAFIGCGLILAASASPAEASGVTIGQLAPGSPPPAVCTGSPADDRLQPTVTSGTSYVVPPFGATITSWSTNASANPSQTLKFKVFRQVSGLTYMVVGHDARDLTAGALNTFTINIAVKPGDVIGATDVNAPTGDACAFSVPPGETFLYRSGSDLADGDSGPFTTSFLDSRLNVSAVVKPLNTVSLGKAIKNKKKGTAEIEASVPGPGDLRASGNGVRAAGAAVIAKTVTAPGEVKLLIKAKGKKLRTLNETGAVKLKVGVTYTPANGDPGTQSVKVKLIKR